MSSSELGTVPPTRPLPPTGSCAAAAGAATSAPTVPAMITVRKVIGHQASCDRPRSDADEQRGNTGRAEASPRAIRQCPTPGGPAVPSRVPLTLLLATVAVPGLG